MNGSWALGALDGALCNRILVEDDDDDDLRTAQAIMAFVLCLPRQQGGDYQQQHIRSEPAANNVARRDIGPRATPIASRQYCNWLLEAPETMFKDLFRMTQPVFFDLCRWLQINEGVQGSRYQSLEQKVMVFLWLCAYNEPQRNTAYRFQISQSSVSRIFHELIDPMRHLHTAFVRLPEARYVSPTVELNPKFMQFNGAIGAIDGTHIPAFIPRDRQQRFWSRKNDISQNVFAAVTFDGLFSYVLAGGEGSMHDATLLRLALLKSFEIPYGRFYLGDAGFGSRRGVLVPFSLVRYHLQDWGDIGERPETQKEIYNLRHSQLRTTVEQAFGRCKRRWKIIRKSSAEYTYDVQIKIVYAVTGLHNFIQLGGLTLEEERQEEEDFLTNWDREMLLSARDRADRVVADRPGQELRELVASWTWEIYREYLVDNGIA